MGINLNIWTREDIEAAIRAVKAAGENRSPEYHEALRHVAMAFGINTPIDAIEGEKAGEDRVVMVGRWQRELPE